MGGAVIPATFAGVASAATPVASPTPTPADSIATHDAPPAKSTAPADYIVKRGDSLSDIAAAYGLSLATVEPLNPGIIAGDRPDDYSLIYAGGHVHLPVGTTPAKHARAHRPVHVWYGSCDSAPTGLHRGQAGYRPALDMDGDGKACEGPWPPITAPVTPPPVDTPPPSNGLVVPVIAPDAPGTPSGYSSGHDWGPLIDQAMGLVGGTVNANHDIAGVEALMMAESGGDPNAINNYDSNAANGTPSEGLMQVIQPTFDANHVAGTSENLYDPLANIAAALQYINNQYGGIIPNSPY